MKRAVQAILLAAGRGTRMVSERAKVLHEILGQPLLEYPLKTLKQLGVKRPVLVVGWQKEEVLKAVDDQVVPAVQSPQKGTGHAVQAAKGKLGNLSGDLIVWPADMTLVRPETVRRLLKEHRQMKSAATVLSSFMLNPRGYGRILRRAGRVIGIREELDATRDEREIHEVNTGVYVFEPRALYDALEKIRPKNRKKEYYLTDTIRLIADSGERVEALPYALPEEAQGINSQADLALATRILNQKNILKHQLNGVTIVSPEQTFVAPDVKIGPGSVIYPWTYLERGVKIGRRCQIGPFAKIRSGTVLGDEAVIGSFVEVVRSRIGKKVLAKHLSYLGDAVVGDGTNIGAGTITANYDGRNKHRTRIGKRAFIGVDTLMIAPVSVADGAKTGAGAVLTRGTKVRKGETVVGVPARSLERTGRKNRKRTR